MERRHRLAGAVVDRRGRNLPVDPKRVEIFQHDRAVVEGQRRADAGGQDVGLHLGLARRLAAVGDLRADRQERADRQDRHHAQPGDGEQPPARHGDLAPDHRRTSTASFSSFDEMATPASSACAASMLNRRRAPS